MDDTINDENQKQVVSYDERIQFLNEIAQPLASKKQTKKIYKLIKKAKKQPNHFWGGLRAVQQKLKKGGEGLMILAGDVSPIDIYSHLPAVCENKGILYCYVPSREDVGTAMGCNRGVICVFIAQHPDYKENYDEVLTEIKSMGSVIGN